MFFIKKGQARGMVRLKRIIKTFLFPMLILCLFENTANCDEGKILLPKLTLNECIDLAKMKNKQYLKSRYAVDANLSLLDREKTSMYTKVKVGVQGLQEAYWGQKLTPLDAFDNLRNTITITQPLFRNRAIRADITDSSLQYKNALLQTQLTLGQTIFSVKQTYWKMVMLSEYLVIQTIRLKKLDKVSELAKFKMKLGQESKLEARWAELQKNIAQSEIFKTTNELSNEKIILKNLIGMNQKEDFILSDPLPKPDDLMDSFINPMEDDYPVDNLLSIKMAWNDVLRQKARIESVKKPWWPLLQFTLGDSYVNGDFYYVNFDSEGNMSLEASTPYDSHQMNNVETHSVGFSASYDIFDGGYAKRSLEYERNVLKIINNEFESLKSDMSAKILEDINDIKDSRQTLKLVSEDKDLGLKKIEMVEFKYRLGEYDLEKVMEVSLDYIDGQKKYLDALYDYNVAVEQLKLDSLVDEYKDG